MWLPSRASLPTRAELPLKLPVGCYGHPVVILSPEVSHRGEVVILIVSVPCLQEVPAVLLLDAKYCVCAPIVDLIWRPEHPSQIPRHGQP